MKSTRQSVLVLVLLAVSSLPVVHKAAPLATLMIRHADLRPGYTRPYTVIGYTHQPEVNGAVQPGTRNELARHGYVISYSAGWAFPVRTSPHAYPGCRCVAAVSESGDQYRDAVGAQWGYLKLLGLEQRLMHVMPVVSGTRPRQIPISRVGDAAAAYYWVPFEPPFPALTIIFRRRNYVMSVTGLGSASGRSWPDPQTRVQPDPVLALARLIDRRIMDPSCTERSCP